MKPSTASVPPAVAGGAASRLPFIQGLRGVAVLLVVSYHAGLPVHGGFVGVDVFFVISGFVITRLLLSDHDLGTPRQLTRFYERRIRRILPALGTLITVVVLASVFLESPIAAQRTTAAIAASATASVANFALYRSTGSYFGAAPNSLPLLHTWSLSVEEQFYLALPILLALAALVSRRRRRREHFGATVVLSGVFIASGFLCLHVTFWGSLGGSRAESLAFYASPTRVWEFAVGGLLVVTARRLLTKRIAEVFAWSGIACILGAALLIGDSATFPGFLALVPVGGTALTIVGCLAGSSASRLLGSTQLSRIGDVSYSLYLWHWPFIVFATGLWPHSSAARLVASGVAVVPSLASYRLIENPMRYRTSTKRFATLRMTAPYVVVPLILSVSLFGAASESWWDRGVDQLAKQVRPQPLGYSIGCHDAAPLSDERLRQCAIGRGDRRLFLVGDSNAAQYAEGLVTVGMQADFSVVLGTMSSCPFVDVIIDQQGADWRSCRRFVKNSTSLSLIHI